MTPGWSIGEDVAPFRWIHIDGREGEATAALNRATRAADARRDAVCDPSDPG